MSEWPALLTLSGMLRSPGLPAQQLKSVAARYRQAPAWASGCALPAYRRFASQGPTSFAATAAHSEFRHSEFRRDEKLARLEAVLFIGNEPLTSRKIAQLASLADGTEARTLIRRLNHYYDAQASAFRVEQVAGGYQLLTRPKFGGWLRRLQQTPVESRISAPAMETLAVVAYRQPVVRAEIESIRGVQCGEILRQLMDRDLVRIVGRAEELGRPFLYATTKRFLRWSGLRSLDDLPRAALLKHKPAGNGQDEHDTRPAARRDDELDPRNDLNEEPEVKIEASPEPALNEPCTNVVAEADRSTREPWELAAIDPRAHADEEELEDDDDDEFEDDDDDEFEDDDDDLDEDEDLEDEDLEDEEWEEVDDDDDDWDDDEDEDWDDDDDDEDEDDDWDDE
ncbi:MAG TPA: SMC-Scp complex subunit ScpB [Pirellulales bacterium]|nr:SMC-Scp complex subunit ScpB [Pirellulales bacterium]